MSIDLAVLAILTSVVEFGRICLHDVETAVTL